MIDKGEDTEYKRGMKLGIALIITGLVLFVANLWAGTQNILAVYAFPFGLVVWGGLRIGVHLRKQNIDRKRR